VNKREAKTDLFTATKFHKLFVKEMAPAFPGLQTYQFPEFKKYLGYGAGAIYSCEIDIPQMSEAKKKKMGLSGNKIYGMIWVSSDINPNGITGPDDIGRTYTIQVHFHGRIRYTQRRWEEGSFVSFYDYARDMETVLKKFKEWVMYTYNPFAAAIRFRTYHWKNNARF
jgi:hypothetical protein